MDLAAGLPPTTRRSKRRMIVVSPREDKNGRLDGTRTRIARLRGGSPVLVRGQGVEIDRRDRLRLLLCHASKNGGSGGIRTRDLLLMRELRYLLRHRANGWAASVMLRVLPGKSRRLHC